MSKLLMKHRTNWKADVYLEFSSEAYLHVSLCSLCLGIYFMAFYQYNYVSVDSQIRTRQREQTSKINRSENSWLSVSTHIFWSFLPLNVSIIFDNIEHINYCVWYMSLILTSPNSLFDLPQTFLLRPYYDVAKFIFLTRFCMRATVVKKNNTRVASVRLQSFCKHINDLSLTN